MSSTEEPTLALMRHHGGPSFAELTQLNLRTTPIIDFSVNSNPYGPCEAVTQAVRSAAFDTYPDTNAEELKHAIAGAYQIAVNRLVIANGAADLIWTLAQVLVKPAMPVLLVEPTFCEFRAACQHRGAQIGEWRARATDDFALDWLALSQAVTEQDARVIYLCNPNSPTGYYVPLREVVDFATKHSGRTLILDQAFLSLSLFANEDRVDLPENIVILRSFTKEHAIAGLRLGYAVMRPDLVHQCERARPYWTINSLAQAAGLAACEQQQFVDESRTKILADLSRMQGRLRAAGFAPLPTSTLYFLMPMRAASTARLRLLKHGIMVRDCSSYGLPDFIRLAARPEHDVDLLLAALAAEGDLC
jgi:histidinol-phosphate/aromatic aminotransferase/cobyric acid decarboxylase-like protein